MHLLFDIVCPSLPLSPSPACIFMHSINPLFSPLSSLFSHSDYGSNQVYRREPTKERPGDRRAKAPEIDLIEGNQKKQNTTTEKIEDINRTDD